MEMTTLDGVPSLSQYAVMRLAAMSRKRSNKAQGNVTSTRVTAIVNTFIRVVLHLAGFALLTLAAFQWNIIAGLAVAGISCFVFSSLMIPAGPENDEEGRRAPDMRTGR